MAEKGVSAKIVSIGIIVGLLISFIGLTTIAATSITDPDVATDPDAVNTARTTDRNAMIVWLVGMLIIGIFLLLGGVACGELSEQAKLGCMIALGLMLAASTWLVTKIGGLFTLYAL